MGKDVKSILVVLGIVGLVFFVSSCNNNEQQKQEKITEIHNDKMRDSMDNMKWEWTDAEMDAMEDKMWTGEEMKDDMMKEEKMQDNMMKTSWIYKEYSTEALANTKWNIVIAFLATWCPACVNADKNLSSETISEWLTILKADYDTYTDLRQKYWVTSQHTFVQVDNTWKMINKWSWSKNSEDILKNIK